MENALATVILNARKAKGYTLAQVSLMTDVSVSYLSDIERGRKTPRLQALKRIINALDIPTDKIFSGHM